MTDEELVKKFVDLHTEAETLLAQDKIKDAKQKYLEVVNAYHEIDKSSLEHFHKEIAYEQVTTLFQKVNESKERVTIPYHLIVAGILVIALSVLVFMKPSIIGFAGFEDVIRQPLSITFTETSVKQITLQDRPMSLLASGTYTGNVKLYYKTGEKFELIFDSAKAQGGTFKDICEETCEIITSSNVIELFAKTEGGTLTLNELAYVTQNNRNSAPAWSANTRTFKAKINTPLTLDLSEYFTDPDDTDLVYLSTSTEGLNIVVQNSLITITPKAPGTKKIVFVASDLQEVIRIPVTIEVA